MVRRILVNLFILVCLASAAAATPTPAATNQAVNRAVTAEVTAEDVGDRAAATLEGIAGIIGEYRRHRDMLVAASSEDSLVLKLQMHLGTDTFMASLEELAGLVDADSEDDHQRELLTRTRGIYQAVTPEIWLVVEEFRREIDNLRSARTWTAPGERLQLESRITEANTRLDRMVIFCGRHLGILPTLDLDPTADIERFQDVLKVRSDELSGRLALGLVRGNELNAELKTRSSDADLGLLVAANRRALDTDAASLGVTLDAMKAQGLATEDLRAQLLDVTQDLASGLLDARLTATLVRRAWDNALRWLVERGPGWVMKAVLVVLIFVAGRLLALLVRKALDKSLRKARLDISQLLQRTIVSTAHNLVLGVTLMVALAQLGLNLGPLLAGLGVVGFILGFAMQDSLSNFASGLMILFYRPYDVGDLVDISGVFGKVEHMSLVSTSILTLDNQKLVVPNSKIWGDVIKNVTDQKVRRVDMVFGISYTDDIPRAERVLEAILKENEMVLADPEPMVRLHTLNESSVDFVVRPWVKTPDYWDVYWEVTRAVKMRFDEEGVSIPFPQRDVHLYQVQAPAGDGDPGEAVLPYTVTGARDEDEEAGDEG